MSVADEYLLGDASMHGKFQMTAEILERFVAGGTREMSVKRVADDTGHTPRDINQICKSLQRAGILVQGEESARSWTIARDPNTITLEDVYRCVAADRRQPQPTANEEADLASSVDLLIMQATIAINQSVFQHLRQFSLGRSHARTSGMFYAATKKFQSAF